MLILGIETSCDETAAAVLTIKNKELNILSNVVASQIEIHKQYGGVVPEVASREHVVKIIPVIKEALKIARAKLADINLLAVSSGPGLIPSLISGVETAKVFSYAKNIPLTAVNHVEGHVFANYIENSCEISYPAIVLTVSGGHTMLLLKKSLTDITLLGDTRDDAAGEAFDKAAKLMNLGYPGGPLISEKAENFIARSQESSIKLPRPMKYAKNYEFSFSGLKTALLYELKKDKHWKKRIDEYCHEYQEAIIETLIHKTIRAAKEFGAKSVMLTGGVSANKKLRSDLQKTVMEKLPGTKFFVPSLEYTTDNAAMIAAAGYFKYLSKKTIDWQDIKATSSWNFNH